MVVSPLKLVKDFFGMDLKAMKAEYTPLTDADKADFVKALTPDPATGVPSYTY